MNAPKEKIEQALHQFANGNIADNAKHLLNVLGYESKRTMRLTPNTAERFLEVFNQDPERRMNPDKALIEKWESIDFIFQLTKDEVPYIRESSENLGDAKYDESIYKSYLFFALKLRGDQYSRTKLSDITREINKLDNKPAMILFQHGEALTFAVIDRRLNEQVPDKDVLLKATLIKDINFADPHRAHIDILSDLSIDELYEKHTFTNFPKLHEAWKKTLDTSELNKRFYKEIADWYFWAVDKVTFPDGAEKDKDVRNKTSIIRLITRLIFVWFIKEKGLVPDSLFNEAKIQELLVNTDPQECTYYKAILQNLFFATLNQEMNTPTKSDNRKFRNRATQSNGRDQNYMVHSLYRYEELFKNKKRAMCLFDKIPFLNGGLFECLDKKDKDDEDKVLRIDGFSDHKKNKLHAPNLLFFSDKEIVDLNAVYDTTGKNYEVRGLIHILDSYKFTVTENTPIEEEVALDPELLGRVFENLLAAYNPETGATARKLTGSYYTPREIVNYMTDESLIAYLKNEFIAYRESQSAFSPATPPSQMDLSGQAEPVQRQLDTQSVVLSNEQKEAIENNLRELISYKGQPRQFTTDETQTLIKAIDGLKVLDPACGSGAFPMGVLQKLVFVLERIDPRNEEWKQRQIDKVRSTIQTAEKIEDSTVRDNTIRDLEREIENINDAFARNELGYGRKLYLIENCIYGVDIQPIAVLIAKLRFFISLVVDQKIDRERENLGVRPLPNLETKFVASDALIDVEKPDQIQIRNLHVVRKEIELSEVRRKHFTARTPRTKNKYRDIDADLRSELSELLKRDGFPDDTTEKIAFWDPYDQNTCADWFDQEWMFNIKVGFDIVLGNPPYINIENLPVKTKNYLFENYQACTGRTDIYVAFLEKSISLLNSKGFMSFILPSAFATQQYGEKMRQVLIESHAIREVVDASSYRIFENATVHNIVLIVGNDKGQHQTKVRLHSNNADFDSRSGTEFCVDQHAFAGLKDSRLETNPLVFESLNVKEKIWQHAVRFDQICFVAYGARLNHRTEKLGKQHYISQSPIPGAKRFCEGKDIERYSFSQDGWLEYTPDEHYNPMFPELFENEKLML